MGLAIAVFYLPVLGVLTIVALVYSKRIRPTSAVGRYWVLRVIAASCVTVAAVLIGGSLFPRNEPYGFTRLFQQMAFGLLLPFGLAIGIHLLRRSLESRFGVEGATWLAAFATGALHSVWVLPLSFVVLLFLACDSSSPLRGTLRSFCT